MTHYPGLKWELGIKVWNGIVGVSPVATACIFGNAHVVKSPPKRQDPEDLEQKSPAWRPASAAIAASREEPMKMRKAPINPKQPSWRHHGLTDTEGLLADFHNSTWRAG